MTIAVDLGRKATKQTNKQKQDLGHSLKVAVTFCIQREISGSMVECLTRDRGATVSSLTGVSVLWSLSKTHLS